MAAVPQKADALAGNRLVRVVPKAEIDRFVDRHTDHMRARVSCDRVTEMGRPPCLCRSAGRRMPAASSKAIAAVRRAPAQWRIAICVRMTSRSREGAGFHVEQGLGLARRPLTGAPRALPPVATASSRTSPHLSDYADGAFKGWRGPRFSALSPTLPT